jgi:hypothetical protein
VPSLATVFFHDWKIGLGSRSAISRSLKTSDPNSSKGLSITIISLYEENLILYGGMVNKKRHICHKNPEIRKKPKKIYDFEKKIRQNTGKTKKARFAPGF